MTILQNPNTSVTQDIAEPYGATEGTPANALTSCGPDDRALWTSALEAVLSWRSNPDKFAPEDRPDLLIVDAAIDYAVDIRDGVSPPSSIVPSGSGRIAFEWRAGEKTLIVEFVGSGEAVLTRFLGDRVVERQQLLRNPRTRKLELEG